MILVKIVITNVQSRFESIFINMKIEIILCLGKLPFFLRFNNFLKYAFFLYFTDYKC